jgi:hypothetical protein
MRYRERIILFSEDQAAYPRGPTPPWLRRALLLCTWFIILYSGWRTLRIFVLSPELYRLDSGPFMARTMLGPPVLLGMTLALWFRFFRDEREGARVFALVAALVLFISLVVIWITTSMGTVRYPWFIHWVLPVCALVYLLYGILGRERGY